MTLDTDLLAIRRKRRREKRCLACGVPTPRAALCQACRQSLRYCPRCEAIHPLAETSQRSAELGRSTSYCLPCGNVVRNKRNRDKHTYLAEQRQRQHPKLPQIKRLYKAGLTYVQIADQIGMNHGTFRALMAHARKTGRWPKTLIRGKGWRKGATNAATP